MSKDKTQSHDATHTTQYQKSPMYMSKEPYVYVERQDSVTCCHTYDSVTDEMSHVPHMNESFHA